MKLSTKGRYGLRAMIELAVNYGDDSLSLQTIAARQLISEGYLEQIAAKLKKAGLVKSVRGANGGYFLARAPQEISVGDVLRAMEGDLRAATCNAQTSEGCANQDCCVTRYVWDKINESIVETVDTMFLDVLAQETIKLREEHSQLQS